MLVVGCSSSDNTTVVLDSGSDSTTPLPGEDAMTPAPGEDAMVGEDASGDDDTTPDSSIADAGHDATTGEMDGSTKEDAGDAAAHDGGDAAADAGHDGGDAGDAGTDAGVVAAPYRLIGRWDLSTAGAAKAEYPGSAVVVNFTGNTLTMNVTETAHQWPETTTTTGTGDYLDVSFYTSAGLAAGTQRIALLGSTAPVSLTTASTTFTTANAATLALGTTAATANYAVIVKATDAFAGAISLNTATPFGTGVVGNGGSIVNSTRGEFSTSAYYKKIEFIGDEQTAGTGVGCTNSTMPASTATPATSDETLSFSYIVSKYFNAYHWTTAVDYGGVAVDGYGNASVAAILPTIWPLTTPVTSTTIDWLPTTAPAAAAISPDAVVLNLSIADLDYIVDTANASTTVQNAAITSFETKYGAYMKNIHAYYPSAYILVVVGPGYPAFQNLANGTTAVTNTLVDSWVQAAITDSTLTAAQIGMIDETGANTTGNYGCEYNDPGTATYTTMATDIETALKGMPTQWTAQ